MIINQQGPVDEGQQSDIKNDTRTITLPPIDQSATKVMQANLYAVTLFIQIYHNLVNLSLQLVYKQEFKCRVA